MTEKEELLELKRKLEIIKKFINATCIYDEHLQGYIFGLTNGQVRTLMSMIKDDENGIMDKKSR